MNAVDLHPFISQTLASEPDIVVKVENLSKVYKLYDSPKDRFKEAVNPFRKKYHRDFYALQDVRFDVGKGETVGIIGRNGSGKSTLLKIITGVLTPTSGTSVVKGRVSALLELGAGFNPELTGRENIYFSGMVMGYSRTEIHSKLNGIMTFADIGDFMDQPVKTYSSGMYMRLAFAVAAHVEADVLLIDETLAVGDAAFVQKCMRFLREFQERGTLLFVSHDPGAVINLCQRAIWLDHGKVREIGMAKDVCEAYLDAIFAAQQGPHDARLAGTTAGASKGDKSQGSPRPSKTGSFQEAKIEVFPFDPSGKGFGKGGAQIVEVKLLSETGEALSWTSGGELVTLIIRAQVSQDIHGAIVGFYVKDRLGQNLFGQNTYGRGHREPIIAKAGQVIETRFSFYMPLLPGGDYSVCAAIAEGTIVQHVQRHWMHDAFIFRVHSNDIRYGLMGIPMESIHVGVQ
jgi:lipopolysaccharide transport system ATP-binding protein